MPASASALTITIGDDNQYAPPSATQDLGAGSFDWEWGPGGSGTFEEHNVVQDEGLFDSGEPVLNRAGGFTVTASAGSFPYFCEIHVGMVGEVSVRPVTASARAGDGIRVAWADATTTTGSSYDVRYKAGKKWKPWRKKTSKPAGTFGRNGKPVKLRKKVKLQARSRAGSATSEWSPVLKLER
ncbi:MAG: cupredoxin domain-containing protein [Solirubrobacterales bacterium]